MSDQSITSAHWDSDPWNTQEITFWSQLPAVQRRLAMKESGDPQGNWVTYTLQSHLAGRLPLERCLSLGCGRGRIERDWAAQEAFLACDAYDISASSIADAKREAADKGYSHIHYAVADIDNIKLPAQSYDVVWAVSSAHHFSSLEHVFSQVAQTLKPDGLFLLHEYVGANRFQFSERQKQVIETCLQLLPIYYRSLPVSFPASGTNGSGMETSKQKSAKWIARRVVDKLREGTLLSTIHRHRRQHQALLVGQRPIKEIAVPTERSVIAIDPSEAIRSNEILPVLKNFFDIVEYRPLGGSILQFLLADIAGNFQDEVGQQWLEIFFQIEDTLQTTGDISSDFAYIVAKPKQSALEAI